MRSRAAARSCSISGGPDPHGSAGADQEKPVAEDRRGSCRNGPIAQAGRLRSRREGSRREERLGTGRGPAYIPAIIGSSSRADG
jgi:hypothetical protein